MRKLAVPFPLALASLLVLGGLAHSAHAHPEWSPVQVNRYLKVVVSDRSRIVYTVLFGDGPALPERKAVDTDANGTLDARERGLLGARIAGLVKAGLVVELDGRPFALPDPTPDVGLAGNSVGPDPFSVDLTFALALSPGTHELWMDDRVAVTNEGDSEIAVDVDVLAPGKLFAAHRRKGAGGLDGKVFTFHGPRFSVLEDRGVTMRVSAAPPANARTLPGWIWFVGALAIATGVATALRGKAT